MMLVPKALKYAAEKHGDQKYGDGIPYVTHLACVVSILHTFNAPIIICAAGALHDVLEDTDTTFEELNLEFGPWVSEIVLAVTNPKEGTRKEKHAIQYPKIREYGTYAIMVKLADRIANVESGGKLGMYQREHAEFQAALKQPTEFVSYPVISMWNHLDELMKDKK